MKDDVPLDGDELQKFDWYYKELWFEKYELAFFGIFLTIFALIPVVGTALLLIMKC